jgi:hypothetical protein
MKWFKCPCPAKSARTVQLGLEELEVRVVLAGLVISQVYVGGGAGATYDQSYVELYNRGSTPVDLSGMSLQVSQAGSTALQEVALKGLVAEGGYLLVGGAQGPNGLPLPVTPDVQGDITLGATSGEVVLAQDAAFLSGPLTLGGPVLDLVGYGAASAFEGSGPAPALNPQQADVRAGGGQTQTGDNSQDFSLAAPDPRNTASPANPANPAGQAGSTPQASGQPAQSATSTNISANVSGSAGSQAVTFTADVTAAVGGTPTGTVAFSVNGVVVNTENLSAGPAGPQARYTTPFAAVPAQQVTAQYSGDGNFAPSASSPIAFPVNPALAASGGSAQGPGAGSGSSSGSLTDTGSGSGSGYGSGSGVDTGSGSSSGSGSLNDMGSGSDSSSQATWGSGSGASSGSGSVSASDTGAGSGSSQAGGPAASTTSSTAPQPGATKATADTARAERETLLRQGLAKLSPAEKAEFDRLVKRAATQTEAKAALDYIDWQLGRLQKKGYIPEDPTAYIASAIRGKLESTRPEALARQRAYEKEMQEREKQEAPLRKAEAERAEQARRERDEEEERQEAARRQQEQERARRELAEVRAGFLAERRARQIRGLLQDAPGGADRRTPPPTPAGPGKPSGALVLRGCD